jgi:hypothetical protein
MNPRINEYHQCAKDGLTLSQTARKLGVKPNSVLRFARDNGLTFHRDNNDLSRLTVQEMADHTTLRGRGIFTSDQALKIVRAERRKVRAPTMAELEKHNADRYKQEATQ